MYNSIAAGNEDAEDAFFKELSKRKNFIFYDGAKDGLEENIQFRYFYSNPDHALEFIIIDIYKRPERAITGSKEIEAYGTINILKERCHHNEELIESVYGFILIEDVELRQVDKTNVRLHLNKNALGDLISAVRYFEKYFCIKGTS